MWPHPLFLIFKRLSPWLLGLTAIAAIAGLGGCGHKGELVLPEPQQPQAAETQGKGTESQPDAENQPATEPDASN